MFHILKGFLSLSPIARFLLLMFPIGRFLHFSLQILIAENTPTSHIAIHVMKVPRRSSMRIHVVAAKSAVYFLHHEYT
jgi:hypothetical protein